jgi:glyoxylase-like metal-dependent hydrolase (beta-lactamase superfamily II)
MTPLPPLAPSVRWFDDWYAIEEIAPGIHAIGEPLYHWYNWNYLFEGSRFSLLFDTGPGDRNIRPVAESLTRSPIVAMPSHLHFDHTGNLHLFDEVAIADLPLLRACLRDGLFHAPDDLFLGDWENRTWKPFPVARWLPTGAAIELGGRTLEIVHTPGHSPDSVTLLDSAANLLFVADFVYPGQLYAQVPGASLADYLSTAQSLLPLLAPDTLLLAAHGKEDSAGAHAAPRLNRSDIADLISALSSLRASGRFVPEIPVNAGMTLLIDEAAFRPWQTGR